MKPWEKQEQRKKQPVPNPREVWNIINQIPTLRVKALAAFAYLTGGRITELVKCDYLRKVHLAKDNEGNPIKDENGLFKVESIERIKLDYPGVCKQNIHKAWDKSRAIWLVDIQNRKNKVNPLKTIPVLIDRESEFIDFIEEYIRPLKDDQALFPFKQKRAWQLLNDNVGWNCHYFRHLRATHLVTVHNMDSFSLLKYMGWTDLRPAQKYVRLNWRDIWR